jgi:spermidine/putrescine transport system permease protein
MIRKREYGVSYTLPLTFWLTVFFVIPISIIFLYSFLKSGIYGGVEWSFSLAGYRALANPVFLKVVSATLNISFWSTALTVLLALPTAYFIARSKYKNLFLFLIIIPFWTNFLIRVYAWIAILGNNGFLNSFLLSTGLITEHVQFLYNKYAVIIVTMYTYLPYAILPLYSTIEKFDFSLLEAARDLGATKQQSMLKVLIPNIKAGVTTAILFVFIPTLGSYAIPQLVGGTDSMMLGNTIARELTITRNWPLASSISVILTAVTMVAVLLFTRLDRRAETTVVKEDSHAAQK